MGKHIHFIVSVDLETGEVAFENDTADARFPDGLVWDDTLGEWRAETEDEFQQGYEKVRPIVYPDN